MRGPQRERATLKYFFQKGDKLTLLSTSEFASANKCPQEHIPDDVWWRVSAAMGDAVGTELRRSGGASPPSKSTKLRLHPHHVQLWGAALPANTLSSALAGPGF